MPRKKIQLDTTLDGARQLIDAAGAFPDVRWNGSQWEARPDPKVGDLLITRVWINALDEHGESIPGEYVHAHAAGFISKGRRDGERTFTSIVWPPLPHLVDSVDPTDVVTSLASLQRSIDEWLAIGGRPAQIQEHNRSFLQERFTIFSAPIQQSVIHAIQSPPEEWLKVEDRPPHYKDGDIVVSMGMPWPIDWPKEKVAATIAESWERVLALDDDKVAALLICFAKWFADTGGGQYGVKARIHVNDILSFRGRKKHHKGGYKPQQKLAVRDDILALRDIHVKTVQTVYEGTGKNRREKPVLVDGPFLEVATESEVNIFGEETPYAFRISPGEWSKPFVGDDRQTAELLQSVMTLDPQQGVGLMAMRIGIYLAPQWRIRARSKNWGQPWTVRSLLEGSRIPIPTDSRLYPRTQDYLDEALTKLHDIGAIKGWQYKDWDEGARPRGWFAKWLETRIVITPPASVLARYKEIATSHRTKAQN